MIVCLCHPTTAREIEDHVRDGASTLDEIGERCGAGTGCGACREEIRDRLRACPGQPVQVRSRAA
jgi:bacterioferritin-associated ferredoxin